MTSVAEAESEQKTVEPPEAPPVDRRDPPSLAAAAPTALVALLLGVATLFGGAFQIRAWAPLSLLALIALVAMAIARAPMPTGKLKAAAIGALWAFVAWTALSAAWAESPALAWEGAGRAALYAALITLALTLTPRHARLIGTVVTVGVAGVAWITLLLVLLTPTEVFLAGRLDAPIDYRNGTAALFAAGFWLVLPHGASRSVSPLLRGAAVASAVVCLGLAFMTQSRGVALGLAVGGVVILLLPPERIRRVWTTVIAVAGVGAVSFWLLAPYRAFQDEALTASRPDITAAGLALGAAALLTGLTVFMLALLDGGLRDYSAAMARGRLAARAVAVMAAVVVVVGVLAAVGNPVDYLQQKRDEFTNINAATTGDTRLGSVSGQRYDTWRIAVSEFRADPLKGAGEGSYRFAYFRERGTDRNLSDAHSLPLRLLSETGIVGLALFLTAVVALLAAIALNWRRASRSAQRSAVGLVGAGAVVLTQATVDWLWLIPGVMGLALLCLALAVPTVETPRVGDSSEGRRIPLWLAGPGAVLFLAATISALLLYVSDVEVRTARAALDRGQVERQLRAADRAADRNPVSVTPMYLQASALEALDRRDEARERLVEALRQEPGNHATMGLLGDFEFRAGNEARARAWYRRALRLNPRDVGLQQLAGAAAGSSSTTP